MKFSLATFKNIFDLSPIKEESNLLTLGILKEEGGASERVCVSALLSDSLREEILDVAHHSWLIDESHEALHEKLLFLVSTSLLLRKLLLGRSILIIRIDAAKKWTETASLTQSDGGA
jgi:hypothetical protein